jgi:PAS domain S-box-containing protein
MHHILIIEDEPGHVALIQRSLTESASVYRVSVACSLREALAIVESDKPDIAFVDYGLPDGTGLDFLRSTEPERTYPVIILTSRGNEQVAVEAIKAGALDYVVKSPAIFAEMPTLIRRCLSEWAAILERQQADSELKANAETFQKILESATEGILLFNPAGEIIHANPAALRIFGYTESEMLGLTVEALVPPESVESHQQARKRYQHAPETTAHGANCQVKARRADGNIFPAEVHLNRIVVGGADLFITFVFDLTERIRLHEREAYARSLEMTLARERELAELKEHFISTVSHEFRTPLSVITTSVYVLKNHLKRLTTEQINARIDTIEAQISRMITMLDDVLEVSRGFAGKIEIQYEPIELVSFARSLLDTIHLTDSVAHDYRFEAPPYPITIQSSSPVLEHILLNLLSNAVKYTPRDGLIALSVGHSGQWAILKVHDSGIGIPQSDQSRLFEPFYRARNVRDIQGTGLGLTIVKQNVEAHGGTITFESIEGVGTTFIVYLPMG